MRLSVVPALKLKNSPIFLSLLFLTLFFYFSSPLELRAEERSISELVAAARQGQLTLDELADAIAVSVEDKPDQALITKVEDLPFPGYESNVADALLKRAQVVLAEKRSSDVRGLLLLAQKLLPTADSKRAKIEHLFEFVESIEAIESSEEVDVARLYAIRAETEEQQAILQARLRGVISDYARAIVEQEQPMQAAVELVNLGNQWGRVAVAPVLPELFLKLKSVSNELLLSDSFSLNDERVEIFLAETLKVEPSFLPDLIALHQRRAVAALESGNAPIAEESYLWILSKRPDPHPANEELRKTLVFADSSTETKDFRDGLLGKLESEDAVDASDSLRLQARDNKGLLFGVLAVVLLFFVFVIYRARQPKSHGKKESSRAERRAKKRGVGYMNVTDGDDEYTQLLKVFGLDEGASESEIKKAYRDAVKKAHPDVAAGGGEPDEELFQHLKQSYDRILQIRSSWFGA